MSWKLVWMTASALWALLLVAALMDDLVLSAAALALARVVEWVARGFRKDIA